MKNKNWVFIVGLIVVFGSIILFICLSLSRKSSNFYIGFAQVLGGLLAGSLTVMGVSWTISNQDKARAEDAIFAEEHRKDDIRQAEERQKEQFRIENLPVFEYRTDQKPINPLHTDSGFFTYVDCPYSLKTDESINSHLNLYLTNIGFSAAHIRSVHLIVKHDEDGEKTIKVGNEDIFVSRGNTFSVQVLFYLSKKQEYRASLKVVVFYSDLIGNQYMQEYDGNISSYNTNNNITADASISNQSDYMILSDQFEYSIPQETANLHEKRNSAIKFYANREKLNNLLNNYLKAKKGESNMEQKMIAANKKFIAGDGYYSSYKEIEKNRIYEVSTEIYRRTRDMKYIKLCKVFRVNIVDETVEEVDKYIIESTIEISNFDQFIDKYGL